MSLHRLLARRRERRANGDRGLALVEMAIVAPLLALIMAGILEYGTLWRDNLTASSSNRAAARVVSNLGDDPLSDYQALLTLDAGLQSISGYTLEYVMVYDASAADGEPNSLCFDVNGDPVKNSGGNCNVYTAADFATVVGLTCTPLSPCNQFPTNGSCSHGSSLTFDFCPQAERETNQTIGLTSIGIWVRIKRDYITGMFPGDGVTIEDFAVMKVEPV